MNIHLFKEFALETLSFYNEIAVYLLFGLLVAGILHVLFPESIVRRHLGKGNIGSVLKSALFGIPLPLCSCGVVPVATSLRRSGASKGSVVSFLITTPQIGADSFMLTYSLIGWVFAGARILASVITALIAGLFINLFEKEDSTHPRESVTVNEVDFRTRLKEVPQYVEYELLGAIVNTLLIGILIAGAVGVFMPDDFFATYMNSPFLSMILMLVIGIPVYVCASASTPIAAALLMKGLSPGAALVFLLSGPATNAVNFTTVLKIIGKKSTAIYIGSIAIVSLALGYLFNVWLGTGFMATVMTHQHDMLPDWLRIGSSILLTIMIGWFYFKTQLWKLFKTNKGNIEVGKLSLDVQGMTCQHCAKNVERAILSVEGTQDVQIFLDQDRVEFELADNNLLNKVKESITAAGYNV